MATQVARLGADWPRSWLVLAFRERDQRRKSRVNRVCRYWIATSSASLAETSAIGDSAVLRPLRDLISLVNGWIEAEFDARLFTLQAEALNTVRDLISNLPKPPSFQPEDGMKKTFRRMSGLRKRS